MNVTRRGISPDHPTPKRDLRGSDKSFAPILPGSSTVYVVEGGTNALALRRHQEPPTVVVSGGVQVRSWVERCRARPAGGVD